MDELFDKDIYYVGDEFVMHAPYMYNLCKKPWMTQKRIYDIVNKYYLPTPSGLPGNDRLWTIKFMVYLQCDGILSHVSGFY